MRSTKVLVLSALLIIAIIAVNVVTVVYLISNNAPDSETDNGEVELSHVPDTMIIHGENGESYRSDGVHSNRIIDIATTNKSRNAAGEYFMEYDSITPNETGAVYVEYLFDENVTFAVDLQFERRIITTKQIYFIMTGEYNGMFCVNTDEGLKTFGRLNPDQYLLEIVVETLE